MCVSGGMRSRGPPIQCVTALLHQELSSPVCLYACESRELNDHHGHDGLDAREQWAVVARTKVDLIKRGGAGVPDIEKVVDRLRKEIIEKGIWTEEDFRAFLPFIMRDRGMFVCVFLCRGFDLLMMFLFLFSFWYRWSS